MFSGIISREGTLNNFPDISELFQSNQSYFLLFDPNEEWEYNEKTNKSLSSNHPWFGKMLRGRVKYVIQKGQFRKVDE